MPGIMLVVPLYQLFANLRLVNSLGALMVSYPTFLMPLACWLLMGYYRSIPEELEEAALIDGCNRFQAFTRVVLPLVLPALMAVALFAVTGVLERVPLRLRLHPEQRRHHPPRGGRALDRGRRLRLGPDHGLGGDDGHPRGAFYALAQRFLVEGLTAGSVKG